MTSHPHMTDRKAMRAFAAPEPEPFRQVRPSAADRKRWQRWHDDLIAAYAYARAA